MLYCSPVYDARDETSQREETLEGGGSVFQHHGQLIRGSDATFKNSWEIGAFHCTQHCTFESWKLTETMTRSRSVQYKVHSFTSTIHTLYSNTYVHF